MGLAACQMDVLHPQGPVGMREVYLLAETSAVMLIVVLPVFFMTFFFAWRYREGAARANYAPTWAYSVPIEIAIWGVPLAIVAFLSWVEWGSTHRLDPFRPLPGTHRVLNVEVVALDWKWLFIYPDQHIATINRLEIPVGVDVDFKITSGSVMNVFFIPQLGTQIYAMAGMQTQVHLLAKNPGMYRGLSANFSGAGFPDMRFEAVAVPSDAFAHWVSEVQSMPGNLNAVNYQRLTGQTANVPVEYFGQVDSKLFANILAQYHGQAAIPPEATE
jgi:cytochrome o ubiquinol oxidase subunit 2